MQIHIIWLLQKATDLDEHCLQKQDISGFSRTRHYENTPIQIYWNFHHQKNENFQIKNSDIFHISAQNKDCGYSLRVPIIYVFEQKYITKTYLYNYDPLKPHFYLVKLGFTGIYIIFLISAQKHKLLVLVRTALPRRF